MVPGKSLAIISRTGQVWHPIGSPNGFAPSSTAPAQSALATAACLAVLLTNSLLVIVDICPSKLDRKSTRLNSSHLVSSYAVFCLKKKTLHHAPCLPAARREAARLP